MGYNTEFSGELKFSNELTTTDLAYLSTILGEDCRDHPEWEEFGAEGLTYMDLEISKDFQSLKWNGAEKTYELPEKINFVIDFMKEEVPNFGLEGMLLAQGEDIYDRYKIVIEEGRAVEVSIEPSGTKVTCPHCEEDFFVE